MADSNFGGPPDSCFVQVYQTALAPCVFGDTSAKRTMVLYGDSHAAMWFTAVNAIAKHDAWKLVILSKGACPASLLPAHIPYTPPGEYTQCDSWHAEMVRRIKALDPDLLVVTQEVAHTPANKVYSPAAWQRGLAQTLEELPAKRKVVLGNIPLSPGPKCLLAHAADVQACSRLSYYILGPFYGAERRAAAQAHATYVNVVPWFCAKRCSPVIGNFDVYFDNAHVAVGYSEYLEGVLGRALHMS